MFISTIRSGIGFWLALAVLFGIPLFATQALAELTLEPGEPLTRRHIERLVSERLGPQPSEHRATINIANHRLPLENRARSPISIAVDALEIDRSSRQYRLDLTASLDDGSSSYLTFNGTVTVEKRVSVLSRDIARNDIVTARDFDERWLPVNAVMDDIVDDPRMLDGKISARSLRAGYPVRQSDLRDVVHVERGDKVMVTYRNGSVLLTAVARALENGTLDDRIVVANIDSKKQFHAIVTGRKKVRVGPESGDGR